MRCHRHGDTIVIDLGDETYYLTPEEARRLVSMSPRAWQLAEDLEALFEERVDWRAEGF